MKKSLYIIFLTIFLLFNTGVVAAESKKDVATEVDDFSIDEDFDDDEDISSTDKDEEKDKPQSKEKKFRIGGYLKIHSSYNFAHESSSPHDGLSSLKGEAMLDMDMKFWGWKLYVNGSVFYNGAYDINGEDEYTSQVLDDYRDGGELKEAYLSGTITDWMDLKVGRQIVVWGKSDYIRVTDVLNPLNYQEPGLTDIKDLRLPVAMTKLGFFFSDFSLYTIAVHEHRYNKMPSYGSDFYMLPYDLPNEVTPENTFRNNEYAVSLEGNFTGWDMAIYHWSGFDDTFYVDSSVKKYNRIEMTGATVNVAWGNTLYKAETAYFDGIRYTGAGTNEYSRGDLLLGIEYTGLTDTTVGFEIVTRYIFDHDDTLQAAGQEENLFQSVFSVSRNFLNETLTISFIAATFGDGGDGAYQRLTCEYDLTDSFKIYGGVIFYKSGDITMFKDVDNNDRVFCDFTYSF